MGVISLTTGYMIPVLATKVTERTKKKFEPFKKNQKDNCIVNRKITSCFNNIKILYRLWENICNFPLNFQ